MRFSIRKFIVVFLFSSVISSTSFASMWDMFDSSSDAVTQETVEKIVDKKVEAAIRKFITDNPSFIIDSVANHQVNQQKKQELAAQGNIKEMLSEIENNPDDPVLGNPIGEVVFVEFFDYTCGYCKRALPAVMELIKSDSNVKVVCKELPILGPNAVIASKASLAVNMIAKDKYSDFHSALMKGRISGKDAVIKIASDLGVNVKDLEETMNSPQVDAMINKNRNLADKVGIRGTPAFIIGGQLVPGAIDLNIMKEMVQKARANQ